MAQPSFVPIADSEKVRPSIPAPIPTKARAGRVGELRSPTVAQGNAIGQTGPDQGFALTLAHRMAPRFHLVDGEHRHDAERGVALLASKRAALFGRAPSIYDLEVAAGLFGFLGDAPEDLVAHRKALFSGIGHDYVIQRELVDSVPVEALEVSAADVQDPAEWRMRLGV